MAITPIFKARKVAGLPCYVDSEKVIEYLKTLPETFDVVFKSPDNKTPRSTQQNNYYWGVVVELIAEKTGYTPDEAHDIIKDEFLKEKKIYTLNGVPKERVRIKSTTDLNTAQMEDFLSFVRMWASQELDLYIPLPREVVVDK